MVDPIYAKSHIYKYKSGTATPASAKNTLQLYLDFNCPFSKKLFTKFNHEIIPVLETTGLASKFDLVFMNVIQPWHGLNSGSLHEVALAVAKNYPELYWDVSQLLFDNVESFYDSETFDLTRHQLTNKIIDLIHSKFSSIDKQVIFDDVKVHINSDGTPSNAGNAVAKDVKYFTRYHRTVGVHGTPTVTINGLVVGNIESSTDALKIVDILKTYH